MNAVDTGIYQKLTGNSGLTSLLSGTAAVYDAIAPAEVATPFVTFQKTSGVPAYRMGGTAYENYVYLIKGIVQDHSPQLAGSIASAIDQALAGTITVTGYKTMLVRRESDLDYTEVVSGKVFRHRGAQYRILAT